MTWNGPPRRVDALPAAGSMEQRLEEAIDALVDVVDEAALLLWTGGKEANVLADLLLYAVGDSPGRSPAPFGTIDTGNAYPEIHQFRGEFCLPMGDRGADTVGPPGGVDGFLVERYDGLIDGVIDNPDDPRGYHGAWDDDVDLPAEDPVPGLPRTPEEWDVPASCGALKVVPLRRFIEDHGFDVLLTGRRADDPLVAGGDAGGLEVHEEVRSPAPHRRVNPLAEWSAANVWAYIKAESVSLPTLYTDEGYQHTDAMCCTDDDQVGEYGEGGRDPDKRAARDRLEDMGYV